MPNSHEHIESEQDMAIVSNVSAATKYLYALSDATKYSPSFWKVGIKSI